MTEKIPALMLRSRYRREMWLNARRVIQQLEKVIPISAAYLMGSFTTRKSRPADVDFIILVQVGEKNAKSRWSVDLVIAPDNKYGQRVLSDAEKWMKQKYGSKKSAMITLKDQG